MATTGELKKHEVLSPIIVDLGKRKKKDVKELRNGTGKLVDEVRECVEELVAGGSCPADAQPIILIVREKPKTGRLMLPW